MKSLIVEEMSILWSAIGRKVLKGLQENTYFLNTLFLNVFSYVYVCGHVNENVVPVEP